ncbi:tripartite tricarboxylate transporter TctB family protein [Alkalilacustris brevis]|uniref:tripartite tricarboxylate transporter TctB family protein n=1 Tax=Alkalilacustris brevis TaxID=2026338 RepID=UPI000E0CD6DA|nr:tripartite tricarboxylate transporter TctB family protein [Alkalilacustris brevis]
MRILFLLAILAGGLFYTYYAFNHLAFLSQTGRLGPGFFPRIVGSGIVFLTLISVVQELLRMRATPEGITLRFDNFSPGALFIILMGVGYLVALRFLDAVPATILFLFATLSVINRGRYLQNVLVSVLVPVAIYILFRKFLNASMPQGLLGLPF